MEFEKVIKKLLIVDDEEEHLNLVKMVALNSYDDLEVFTALSSKEAIDIFNSTTFDAVILDVSLPDITGSYLGDLIRTSCPDIPIAFLSNYNGEVTKENATMIKADYWYKPEVFGDLSILVNKLVALIGTAHCENLNKIVIPSIIEDNE